MDTSTAQTLKMIFVDPLNNLTNQLISVIPNILAALAILTAGYFLAKFFSFLTKKFLEKIAIDKLAIKSGMGELLANIDSNITLSSLLSKIIYYIILITFIMSSAEALHMQIMADALKSILLYLPNVIASIFVLIFGFMIANSAKSIITKSADGMNLDFSVALGKVIYALVAVITVSLAIGQLEINTDLLNQAASIILIAIGVALALSLGLGTKGLSSLIISGNYIRDIYKTGDKIKVAGISGEILSIGAVKTIIKTDDDKEVAISNEVILNSNTTKE
jgi:small-conductance mechanosensitive channel